MEFEFSWMTYFVALFALMVCAIALSLLCPGAGRRRDAPPPASEPDAKSDTPESTSPPRAP